MLHVNVRNGILAFAGGFNHVELNISLRSEDATISLNTFSSPRSMVFGRFHWSYAV